jgi:hypothetical protein
MLLVIAERKVALLALVGSFARLGLLATLVLYNATQSYKHVAFMLHFRIPSLVAHAYLGVSTTT